MNQDRGSDRGEYNKSESRDKERDSDSRRDDKPKSRDYDGPAGMQPEGDIEVLQKKLIIKYFVLARVRCRVIIGRLQFLLRYMT